MKRPTSFDEQVDILIERRLSISGRDEVKSILSRVNYYRLMGYAFHFQNKRTERYYNSISFFKIWEFYLADQQFRSIMMRHLEKIEVQIKTELANLLAMDSNSGGCCYDNTFYKSVEACEKFQKLFAMEVEKRKNLRFIKHHEVKYGGEIPIWVLVEILSFGEISKLYQALSAGNKNKLSNFYGLNSISILESWLYSLVDLRNMCAHGDRFFKSKMKVNPAAYSDGIIDYRFEAPYSVFNPIRIINILSKEKNIGDVLIAEIMDFTAQHTLIDPSMDYGFPENWADILRSDHNNHNRFCY